MVTRFPDTRVPFLDDLVVKLDGMRSAVEGVVEGVVSDFRKATDAENNEQGRLVSDS